MLDFHIVPETIDWCKQHYVPPISEYIHCKSFGRCDGTDGRCVWCQEMMPYQFAMCSDETWIAGLLSPGACIPAASRADAAEFIEKYKQRHFARSK